MPNIWTTTRRDTPHDTVSSARSAGMHIGGKLVGTTHTATHGVTCSEADAHISRLPNAQACEGARVVPRPGHDTALSREPKRVDEIGSNAANNGVGGNNGRQALGKARCRGFHEVVVPASGQVTHGGSLHFT